MRLDVTNRHLAVTQFIYQCNIPKKNITKCHFYCLKTESRQFQNYTSEYDTFRLNRLTFIFLFYLVRHMEVNTIIGIIFAVASN